MNTPFPSRFAFAIAHPIASSTAPARSVAAEGPSVRAAFLGLSLLALAAIAALVAS